MTDTTFDPAALMALLDDASPAPWVQETPGSDIIKCPLYTVAETIDSSHDAAFVVAARNQLPALLDALAAARDELAEAKRENDLLGRQQQALLDLCHNIARLRGASVVLGLIYGKLITDPADAAPQADEPKARTYRDMPVVNCGTDLSHMAHVYPVNGEKVVCAGLLPHSVPIAEVAAVPGDDEPEIPNNPYPPGDPRGWTRFKDCPSHFCAAQRQHMPSCQQDDLIDTTAERAA